MSATRDQTQKIAFVYSNLYQLYQKGKTAAQNAPDFAKPEAPSAQAPSPAPQAAPAPLPKSPLNTSVILKAEDLHQKDKVQAKVRGYSPAEFIGKRVARPEAIAKPQAPKGAVASLKDNLQSLNDLHARLRFMLEELEGLVKE